nr:hypothetical protein [bacterium]
MMPDEIKCSRGRTLAGWMMLGAAAILGTLYLNTGCFVDEADNLVAGRMMCDGDILYRDIFSHHFPFPYAWCASVIAVTGQSILRIRLVLWIFQLAAFALLMVWTRRVLTISLTALLWSILRAVYWGHLILYSAFSATGLLVVFTLTLALLFRRCAPSWPFRIIFAAAACMAVLSDPLAAYPVAVALIAIFVRSPRAGLGTGSLLVTGILLCGILLWSAGALEDFISQAVDFNTHIYSRYVHKSTLPIGKFLRLSLTGLGITDPQWFDPDPLKPLAIATSPELDRWLFTGFFYRATVLFTCILLLAKKEWKTALFIYFFCVSLLLMHPWGVRSQPFVLIALSLMAVVITGAWIRQSPLVRHTGRWVIVLALVWLCGRVLVAGHICMEQHDVPSVARYRAAAEVARTLACGQSDVQLAYYPGGTYTYWYCDLKPVDGCLFMWPWIADARLDGVIRELQRVDIRAIVAIDHCTIWEYFDTNDYLTPLFRFLDTHYVCIAESVYISPALHDICGNPLAD